MAVRGDRRKNDDIILEKIDSLTELIELKFKYNGEQHEEIVKHQKETNGRVTKLEKYKNIMTGAVAVSNVIVIPLLMFIIVQHFKG